MRGARKIPRFCRGSGRQGAFMQGQERERKEPSEFNVIVKAKDLVKHTFTITNSTERYPKKYRFTLVNRIQEKAVDIYEMTDRKSVG